MGAVWHEGDSVTQMCLSPSSQPGPPAPPAGPEAQGRHRLGPQVCPRPCCQQPCAQPRPCRAWWGCLDGLQPCHLPSLFPMITRGLAVLSLSPPWPCLGAAGLHPPEDHCLACVWVACSSWLVLKWTAPLWLLPGNSLPSLVVPS